MPKIEFFCLSFLKILEFSKKILEFLGKSLNLMVNFGKNKKVLMSSSQFIDIFWFNYAVKLIFGLEFEFFSLIF